MFVLSIGCLFAGYRIANLEKQNLSEMLLASAESDIRQIRLGTKRDLDLLFALQNEDVEFVKKHLTAAVKHGLSGPAKADEKLRSKALEYQSRFCEGRCLGL